jgi:4-amino-4-deoxy-L-arabinose transferase-like glycosyltransferase
MDLRFNIIRVPKNPLMAEYYPAHFPLYPAVISIFDIFLKGPTAMLLSTLLGTILCFIIFYKYAKETLGEKVAWTVSLVFLIFPFRFLALRAVGSPEPWFIIFTMSSLLAFKKERFWLLAFGGLAMLTSPAMILFIAYSIYPFLLTF